MKWKKYIGETEQEAYLKVKEDLGDNAFIINVKRIKPTGVSKLFKKPFVEVLATDDERFLKPRNKEKNTKSFLDGFLGSAYTKNKRDSLSKELNNNDEKISYTYDEKDDYLIRQTKANSRYKSKNDFQKIQIKEADPKEIVENMNKNFSEEDNSIIPDIAVEGSKIKTNSSDFIKAIYDQLLENEVLEENINILTEGAHGLGDEEKKEIVAIVYKRIIEILSDYETIKKKDGNVVFFIGPTGVGKTTTIAKIASYFILNQGFKVALITADTYRIAAVEQLKTYANILNIPITVVYDEKDLKVAIDKFKHFDLVFVDTAGRSHKNETRHLELAKLLNVVDKKDIFLLLSAATKFKDIKSITQKYSDICDYKIIFTKLDETMSYGNILNTKLLTGSKLSYVTFGQSVPEDISMLKPAEIAKNILGGAK